MANSNLETLLIVFIAITGLSVLLQACVLLGMYLTMRKAVTVAKEQADEYREALTPVLESSKRLMGTANELVVASKDLVAAIEPQLRIAATELAEMTISAREQADRLQITTEEISEGVRKQAARVDGMTTSVLNRVDRFGNFLADAINVPIRQVSGVVAAAKAIVDTLRAPAPPRTHRAPTGVPTEDQKDLFV